MSLVVQMSTLATIDQIRSRRAFHTCGTRLDWAYVGHGGGGYAYCDKCFVRVPTGGCLSAPPAKATL